MEHITAHNSDKNCQNIVSLEPAYDTTDIRNNEILVEKFRHSNDGHSGAMKTV